MSVGWIQPFESSSWKKMRNGQAWMKVELISDEMAPGSSPECTSPECT